MKQNDAFDTVIAWLFSKMLWSHADPLKSNTGTYVWAEKPEKKQEVPDRQTARQRIYARLKIAGVQPLLEDAIKKIEKSQ